MKSNTLITVLMVGGGAYLLYWYVNNFGPQGAATDSSGNPIPGTTSYWASWFGGSAAAATTTSTSTVAPAQTSTQPAQITGSTTPTTSSSPVMATSQQISQLQSLIRPQDLSAFQAMLPTLTQAQASQMISNAQACSSAQYDLATQSCATPAASSTSASSTSASPSTSVLTMDPSTLANVLGQAMATALPSSIGAGGATVSQWNYVLSHMYPGANIITGGGPSTNISATAYVQLYQSQAPGITYGMSGLGEILPIAPTITGIQPPLSGGMGDLAGRVTVARRSPWGKLPLMSRAVN